MIDHYVLQNHWSWKHKNSKGNIQLSWINQIIEETKTNRFSLDKAVNFINWLNILKKSCIELNSLILYNFTNII